MRLDILLPILLAVGALAWIYRRDRRRFEAERAMLLDDAAGLLEAAVASREAMGYPRLRGRYKGYEASIDAVLDNLSVRKIPSLWLRVTVRADLPFAGSCDMLARAHNVEFYSPSIDFDHVLPLPAGWPEQLTIKSDDPEHMPLPEDKKHQALHEGLITGRYVHQVHAVGHGSVQGDHGVQGGSVHGDGVCAHFMTHQVEDVHRGGGHIGVEGVDGHVQLLAVARVGP